MTNERQAGLLPSWQKGALIKDAFKFLTQLTLLVQVGSFFLGLVLPAMAPSGVSIWDLLLGLVFGAIFGSVWIGIDRGNLVIALAGLITTGLVFTGLIILQIIRTMSDNTTSGLFEGFLIYVCGSAFVVACWWSARQLLEERRRRKEKTGL